VQADGEWFGERRSLEGYMPGNLDALRRRGVEDAGETALHVRRLRRRAHEIDVLAEIGAVLEAAGATPAPARRIDRDVVADAQAFHRAVDLDDFAGDLVAENQRRGNDEIAGARMAKIVQVGAADTTRAEAHPHHARRERP
jgi:hypothetical protein